MKKTIKLAGVESDMKKITLLEDGGRTNKDGEPKFEKYKIWITKKDGNQTKAYTQFQVINPKAGDTFDLEVAEEQKEFNGFPYTDRTVMFFYTQDNAPVATRTLPQATTAPPQPQAPQGGTMTLELRLDALEARIKVLEGNHIASSKPLTANIGGVKEKVPDCFYQDDEIQLDEIV